MTIFRKLCLIFESNSSLRRPFGTVWSQKHAQEVMIAVVVKLSNGKNKRKPQSVSLEKSLLAFFVDTHGIALEMTKLWKVPK